QGGPAVIATPEGAQSLQRQHLCFFLRRCFLHLHPDEEFLEAKHVEAICVQLERMLRGEGRRLLITVPPRHLKSICTAVAFVAWALGRDPSLKVLVASYGTDLALKHGRDCRALMEAAWYREMFPRTRLERSTDLDLVTTRVGGRKAVSLGGPVTGFGADIIIIDDLMKAADAGSETERARVRDYYEQTLFTRLNDKANGCIVAIQQRLHEEDLAGYLIDKGFEHLNLPAVAEEPQDLPLLFHRRFRRNKGDPLFPAREPLSVLENIRKEIGTFAFSAQYQQNPVAPEGNRLRWEWFEPYQEELPRTHFQQVVQSWDTALTAEPSSDFTVCTTWGFREGRWYLLDLLRERLDYPDIKRAIQAQRQHWRADLVLIEYANSGIPLFREFRNERRGALTPYKPSTDKLTRAIAQTAKLEAGQVLVPLQAPWLAAFRDEVRAFPMGRYDDQVDSMVQFLDWSGSRRGRGWCDRQANGGRPSGRPRRTTSRVGRSLDPLAQIRSSGL
ncbi:MAG TPA: phage terminase large subunit, partial [Alphaproteobacteria bacterium]|nr:phage terminase large subunit [Alphaproteobacteria bacterium]